MKYRFIIFDMDGTLTEEILDYEAIRREIGATKALPILEFIATLSAEEQAQVQLILDRHEFGAAERCGVHDGAYELLETLRTKGIQVALLTRNSPYAAQTILRRHGLWDFFVHIATRDDKPYKPHPDAILNILRKYQMDPRQTLMVGDYLYDLQAASAAGVDSALLVLEDGRPRPAFADQATYVIGRLSEIMNLMAAGGEGIF